MKAPPYPVKVRVWCAVSAKKIVGPVFRNEKIACERYVHDILRQFFPKLTEEERLRLVSARLRYRQYCTYIYAGFVRCLWEQNY
jgi:hypothetical protein